jgi:hypothetical protein
MLLCLLIFHGIKLYIWQWNFILFNLIWIVLSTFRNFLLLITLNNLLGWFLNFTLSWLRIIFCFLLFFNLWLLNWYLLSLFLRKLQLLFYLFIWFSQMFYTFILIFSFIFNNYIHCIDFLYNIIHFLILWPRLFTIHFLTATVSFIVLALTCFKLKFSNCIIRISQCWLLPLLSLLLLLE